MSALDAIALPLSGTSLIEASAGTGKTHTITTLYLRLLLERGRAVSEILVVTYTRAATRELRDRIRGRIAACLRVHRALGRGQDVQDMASDRDLARDPELLVVLRALDAAASPAAHARLIASAPPPSGLTRRR
jgi:exodeoxyribonuclease V beta subunit